MSWDVLIIDVPAGLPSATALARDFKSRLGPAASIGGLLASLFRDIDLAEVS